MLDFLWNTASFIIALSILVAIHEYGHFWVARRCGVKVHRFSLGFGKVLFKKIDKHGTEFAVAAIPLGGYVKMLDSRVEEVPEELAEFAFNNKTVWQRIAIVAAGPIANFLLAIVAFFFMYSIGVNSAKPIMNGVKEGSPASVIKQQWFEVEAVNGQPVHDWEALNLELVAQIGEPSVELTIAPILRSNSQIVNEPSQTYTVSLQKWLFDPKKQSIVSSLGFIPYSPKVHLIAANISEDSAAQRSGILKGDKLLTINGQALDDWAQFVELIQNNPNNSLQLQIERQAESKTLTLTPDSRELADGMVQGFIGLAPQVDDYPEQFRVNLQYGVVDAVLKGIDKTWQLSELTFNTLVKLVTGDLSVKNLSGPIGIAKGAGMSADYGFVYFLGFIALISVNLGIMNLIPLPVLDGGHLVYYFIEAVTGKEVSERVQEIGFKIGAAVLVTFMSIAVLNDLNLL
ncbi:sigma E protease regulator RseP [Psychromonas sp. 14N.309.X.WAT.B.A12]|uniref:sigma E protease regulator RseP n=1 Tax=Psychromonas sp. 14N.309.X.WAT.B.A12 TaxID=2998322 RepID=UPI0025B073ED|nr:sigma E protease regulator RseP [Psychromonas sp. 14N.309.X.WAT.B.A12]MDN2662899.1 sigma E protease regulator RseP [Psychromonas sp. 14N.309.X.WAT.B.A12]